MNQVDLMPIILSILALLQIISLAFGKWIHTTLIELIKQNAGLSQQLTNIPVAEIAANRHKIASLDKAIDQISNRLTHMENNYGKLRTREEHD